MYPWYAKSALATSLLIYYLAGSIYDRVWLDRHWISIND